MGGPGSGTWYRWNKKTYAEEVKRIDIRYLKKQNLLRPDHSGTLSWSTNGEPSGYIRYSMWADKMQLHYKSRLYGEDEWQKIEDTIRFDKTACHFGGFRKWFICPSCNKKVAVLYSSGYLFRCRKCTGMTYACQSENQLDRMVRKARKIRHKLAIDSEWWDADCLSDPIFEKPNGMRWRTFERLKQAEDELQENIDYGFFVRFGHWL